MNKVILIIAAASAVLGSVNRAEATVPGFTDCSPSIDRADGHLLVNIHEEGLTPGKVTYRIAAHAKLTLQNGEVVNTDVAERKVLAAGPSGSAIGVMELPSIQQRGRVASIVYSDIVVEDITNGVPADTDGVVAMTFNSHGLTARHAKKMKKHRKAVAARHRH